MEHGVAKAAAGTAKESGKAVAAVRASTAKAARGAQAKEASSRGTAAQGKAAVAPTKAAAAKPASGKAAATPTAKVATGKAAARAANAATSRRVTAPPKAGSAAAGSSAKGVAEAPAKAKASPATSKAQKGGLGLAGDAESEATLLAEAAGKGGGAADVTVSRGTVATEETAAPGPLRHRVALRSASIPLPEPPKRPPTPLPAVTLAKLRRLLEEERVTYLRQAEELAAEANALTAEREPGDTQFDEESGEGDTIAVERERDLALSASARQAVEEIDRAIARMDGGSYGSCGACGNKIPIARLEALPYAALCISCKSREERRR